MSEDAGTEPGTVATLSLAVRRSNHSAQFRPHPDSQMIVPLNVAIAKTAPLLPPPPHPALPQPTEAGCYLPHRDKRNTAKGKGVGILPVLADGEVA